MPVDQYAAGPATTMRAIVQDTYGSADVLRIWQIARPVPGAGQVLVRAAAAGLDRGTWHLRTGTPCLMRLVCGLTRPRNPVLGRTCRRHRGRHWASGDRVRHR
jgi:hypothetical protein